MKRIGRGVGIGNHAQTACSRCVTRSSQSRYAADRCLTSPVSSILGRLVERNSCTSTFGKQLCLSETFLVSEVQYSNVAMDQE